MDRLFSATGDSELGHARKGKKPRDVTLFDDEDRAVCAFGFAAREDAAFEEDRHVLRLRAFFVDDFTSGEASFHAIGDKPLQMFLWKVSEDGNFSDFVDQARQIGLGHLGKPLGVAHDTFARYW